MQLTEYQGKQAGLAHAIGARDADFLSGVDVEVGIGEELAGTTTNTEMMKLKYVCRFYCNARQAAYV
ncbi:MAG: hypothetical protein JAY74_18935 [Candidatus Thiodiazotropha taylori]|nr:hypothetical protein [Candidatus Thiodiazotropha taylori]